MMKIRIVLLILICIVFGSGRDVNAFDSNFKKCLDENIMKQNTTTSSLKTLDCSNRNIKSIEGIEKYTNLRVLYLNNNKITRIPKNISKLKKLEDFSIAGNVIYYLPEEINQLVNLRSLNADSTHLLELNNISNLTNIKILSLNNNQLFVLPNLEKLNLIDLSVDNNFLLNKTIKTKNKTFNIKNQRSLICLNSTFVFGDKNSLFSIQEEFQRNITDKNKRALNGIKKYLIYNARKGNGEPININDYINIETGKVHKAGDIYGLISLKLENNNVKTKIPIKINISDNKKDIVITYNLKLPILKNTIQNTKNKTNNNITAKAKKANDSSQERLFFDTKEYKEIDSYNFLISDNEYLLIILLLIFTLIPVLLIIFIIYKIKQYNEDAKSIGI